MNVPRYAITRINGLPNSHKFLTFELCFDEQKGLVIYKVIEKSFVPARFVIGVPIKSILSILVQDPDLKLKQQHGYSEKTFYEDISSYRDRHRLVATSIKKYAHKYF
jgi:hypothetical protein